MPAPFPVGRPVAVILTGRPDSTLARTTHDDLRAGPNMICIRKHRCGMLSQCSLRI